MKYLVDLEKKEIVYDSKVPAGHVIALKKIFKEKGYIFKEISSLETVSELRDEMNEVVKSGSYTKIHQYPAMPSESYRISILNTEDNKYGYDDPMEHMSLEKAILEYFQSTSRELTLGDMMQLCEDQGIRMTERLYKAILHIEKDRILGNDIRHTHKEMQEVEEVKTTKSWIQNVSEKLKIRV